MEENSVMLDFSQPYHNGSLGADRFWLSGPMQLKMAVLPLTF
jgi:hypothetical protein